MSMMRDLQQRLTVLGFNPGPHDGKWGRKTFTANMAALDKIPSKPANDDNEPDKSAMAAKLPSGDIPDDHKCQILSAGRFVNELIWHCAATPEGRDYTKETIDRWHKARWKSGLGYHYLVHRDGRLEIGRPVNKNGVHVRGHNSRGTIAACYIGGVARNGKTPKDTRTPEQRASMLWLTRQLAAKHRLKKISGHNQYAAKACPSFDVPHDELGNISGFKRGIRKFFAR